MKDKYEVRFFAVGNKSKGGDAIVIRVFDDDDNQHIAVVDGGYSANGDEIVRFIVDECKSDTIDVMFNTHPDIDHIAGLVRILESDEVKVEKLVMNRPWTDANLNSSYFKDGRITEKSLANRIIDNFKKAKELSDLAEEKGIDIIHPVVNNTYLDCLTIIGPTKEHYRNYLLASEKTPDTNAVFSGPYGFQRKVLSIVRYYKGFVIRWYDDESTSDINETSIVLVLEIGDMKLLLTGDVGKAGLNAALDTWETSGHSGKDITKVQLPHHGSRKNIDPQILRRIGAKCYYVSCPPDGFDEGHPSRRLENKIREIWPDASIYHTRGKWLSSYKGVNIKGVPATNAPIYDEMDGPLQ